MDHIHKDKIIDMSAGQAGGRHTSEFRYDGLDRRVGIVETENGVEQSNHVFIWYGSQIAQKRDSTGSTVERNYFAGGFEEDGNDYYYTKDHLGSIREVVASDGTTVESVYDYSPWGGVTKTGGASNGIQSDFLYTGHFYHDESDLHLTLYRAYNPELGMWLARDSFENITGSPGELLEDGSNLYAYVGNNPISLIDPNGLWGIDPQSEKHTHRNRNNRCPSKEPEYKKSPRGYRDCEGGKWSKDPQWNADKYHGGHNTYRGSERNKGSQCVYDNAGRLIDSGPHMGTYDYSPPADILRHLINDVIPHEKNPNYESGLTEQFGCD
jgi:RHS repeat-associated protein